MCLLLMSIEICRKQHVLISIERKDGIKVELTDELVWISNDKAIENIYNNLFVQDPFMYDPYPYDTVAEMAIDRFGGKMKIVNVLESPVRGMIM